MDDSDYLRIKPKCWKCGKHIWLWQSEGEKLSVTPYLIMLSHEKCNGSDNG